MNKKAQNEAYWVLAVVIILLLVFLLWAAFTGKVGGFLRGWELP